MYTVMIVQHKYNQSLVVGTQRAQILASKNQSHQRSGLC